MVVKQPFEEQPVYVVKDRHGTEKVLHCDELKHCPWPPDDPPTVAEPSDGTLSSSSEDESSSLPMGYTLHQVPVTMPGCASLGPRHEAVSSPHDADNDPGAVEDMAPPRRYPVRSTRNKLPERLTT